MAGSSGGLPVSDIPLPENVSLIGLARGTEVRRLFGAQKLTGGETLILLGPEESLSRTRRALKKLVQEKTP